MRSFKSQFIIVTSCKGGVGKSTVASNLALSLAKREKKVLLIDFDYGVRCLDLILGCEDEVIFDFSDLLAPNTSAEKVILHGVKTPTLDLCAAPHSSAFLSMKDSCSNAILTLIESQKYDYIIADNPAGQACFDIFPALSPKAIIVTSHPMTSLRAAELTSESLESVGIKQKMLVINNFDQASVLNRTRPGIIEIADRISIQLLGVIPFDPVLMQAQEHGILASEIGHSNASHAFSNIAARLIGENIPLMMGFKKCKRRRLLK